MTVEVPARGRANATTRRRWLVHVVLIVGFLAAAASPVFLSRRYLGNSGVTDHAIICAIVLGLVVVHLFQRRRTVRRLVTQLLRGRDPVAARSSPARTDLVLWLLTLNAMASGLADYLAGHPIYLPIPGPYVLQKWHAVSAVVLVIYVTTHVVRRRRRLRLSHIM